jgi:hypothetical protein
MPEAPKPYIVSYDYSDAPTLRKFAMSDKRVRCIIGPFGSGKSSTCVMEIIRKAQEQVPGSDGIRRSRWAVIRNTFRQLNDTTIKTFLEWFPPKVFGEYKVTTHDYYITKFPGVHLETMFRALDNPQDVSNLLSLELTGAWFNEVREIAPAIIVAMDGRINRYPSMKDGGPSWTGMIMDTNPPDDDSYIYKMFEKVRPKNWEVFHQPSGLSANAENTKHLPKGYYSDLAQGKDEMYIRVYIHGQYGYMLSGRPVFTGFVDNVHVARHVLEPIKGLDLLIGFDFGLQPACTIAQITPLGQLRILDELVSDGMAIKQFSINQLLPLLRTKYFGYNVLGYGDPAGNVRSQTDESTCFDILHGADIGLINVNEAPTNALVPRINAVEKFLNKMTKGEPGFLLSPNCTFLRKALNGGYHYALEKTFRGGEQEWKQVPLKNFSSHICLSGKTMVLTKDGEKRLDSIKIGDIVVTPFGNRKVIATGLTQKQAKVFQITMSNGTKIVCTENHKFILANKSIAKCNALEYNALQEYNSWRTLVWSIQSLLSSTARNIGFQQAIITGQKTGGKERVIFTEPFGSFITNVRFLMGMMSTMLMKTLSIMIFPILNLSTVPNTQGYICKKELMTERGILKNTWRKQGSKQNNGINQQKVENGISNMEGIVGKIKNIILLSAKFAGKTSALLSQQKLNTAGIIVRQKQGIEVARMKFKERVLFVVQTLWRINILKLRPAPKIVQISQCSEPEDVYNITVEKDHVFYANGILTCNCDSLEYLCLYIDIKEEYDKQRKDFLGQIKKDKQIMGDYISGY